LSLYIWCPPLLMPQLSQVTASVEQVKQFELHSPQWVVLNYHCPAGHDPHILLFILNRFPPVHDVQFVPETWQVKQGAVHETQVGFELSKPPYCVFGHKEVHPSLKK